jgi:hypothetical protein
MAVNWNTSTYTAQGQLNDDYDTISITGSGIAVGTSPGVFGGTWHWSIALQDYTTLTRRRPYPPLTLQITVNQTTFAAGQTLNATVEFMNPGFAQTVDVYVGILRPDGRLQFFTDMSGGSAFGSFGDVASYHPIAKGISLATPFSVIESNFYSHQWTGSDLHGAYVFFIGAATAGALPTQDKILDLATASFAFP